MALASPIDLEEFEASVADPMAATFFPPRAYTSEAFYRFELEAIWSREWVCVGRLEEIAAPGDYFAITIAEEPLLIVRASEDEVGGDVGGVPPPRHAGRRGHRQLRPRVRLPVPQLGL